MRSMERLDTAGLEPVARQVSQKKLSLLSKYSVATPFYYSKYKKYTSEPKFSFTFSKKCDL